jgi:plasmid rolling circle replication initiator protein Rep
VAVLPEEYFYPEVAYWNKGNLDKACRVITAWNEKECKELADYPNGHYTSNTHAVHHWECTWCRGDRTHEYVKITDIIPRKHLERPSDGWL